MKLLASVAVLLLAGCNYMNDSEISAAAKRCVESGGAPDFGRAGRYNGGPIYRVTCYGNGTPSISYSAKHEAKEWERICEGVGRKARVGIGGAWECELRGIAKTDTPNWTGH